MSDVELGLALLVISLVSSAPRFLFIKHQFVVQACPNFGQLIDAGSSGSVVLSSKHKRAAGHDNWVCHQLPRPQGQRGACNF